MTNFEKHRNEIERIVASKGSLAKVNGELRLCKDTICNDCEFNKAGVSCHSVFIQWAMEDEEIDKSCRFCKYGDRVENEYPCIECTERYLNQFEPKPKEPELKPCPFCGKDARMCHTGREHHYVQCVGCACSTMSYETPIEAIEVWNRRV